MQAQAKQDDRPNRRAVIKGGAAAGLLAGTGAFAQGVGTGSGKPHVVILGAGLAGLCAAYRLQQNGCTYTLLEAERSHVGGRVRTVHFGDGLHAEFGAMRIPEPHTTALGYVHAFGLGHRPFVLGNDNAFVYARGQAIRIGDKPALRRLYQLRAWEQERTPDDLWTHGVLRHLDGLTAEEKADLADSNSFRTKKISDYDRLSLRRLLEVSGLSDEAIEYLLVAWGALTLQHSAATEHLREELTRIWSIGKFYELVDGTEALPKAFLSRLQAPPRMGCEVVNIRQDSQRRTATAVFMNDGRQDEVTGDFVLCTIPFPVLSRLHLPFSGPKARAIHEVWYESATKVLVPTSTRFWERDPAKPIFGGGSFTDLLAGWIYYPSDNAIDRNPERSKGPGVLLASYNCGQDARRLGTMPKSERERLVIKLVSKLHPELEQSGMVLWDKVTSWSWDHYPWAGGAYAFYMPGQFSSLHQDVVAPEGRIHFAGEHCSRAHTWMEGALTSAESAVDAILRESGNAVPARNG